MAESKRDYYEVLGVSKDADEATLKKAYRQVAKKYHPDMNPGDAEAEKKFKEASEAYAVLSDPEKRRQYDQFGHAAFDGSAGAGGGYGGFDFNGADFGDIFGDIFGDLFGGGRRGGRANQGPMKGMNIRKSVRITFEEAVFGCEKELDVVLKDPCPKCNGTGAKPGTSPETCPKCGGKGQIVYTQQSFFGTVQNVQTCPDCQSLRQFSFLFQIKEYLIHDMILNIIQHRLFIRNNGNIADCFFWIITFIIDHHSGEHIIPVWLHQTVQRLFCCFPGCDHQKFTPFFAVIDPFSDYSFPSESYEPHHTSTDRIGSEDNQS